MTFHPAYAVSAMKLVSSASQSAGGFLQGTAGARPARKAVGFALNTAGLIAGNIPEEWMKRWSKQSALDLTAFVLGFAPDRMDAEMITTLSASLKKIPEVTEALAPGGVDFIGDLSTAAFNTVAVCRMVGKGGPIAGIAVGIALGAGIGYFSAYTYKDRTSARAAYGSLLGTQNYDFTAASGERLQFFKNIKKTQQLQSRYYRKTQKLQASLL